MREKNDYSLEIAEKAANACGQLEKMTDKNKEIEKRIKVLTTGAWRDNIVKHPKNGANENGEGAMRFLKTIQREREERTVRF